MQAMQALVAIAWFATAALGVEVPPMPPTPLPTGRPAGTITWVKVDSGMCGDGTPAYYGYVEPAQNTHPDKFFIMMVGGSVCWNKEMCQDEWDRAWMSFDGFSEQKLGADEITREMFKNGTSMPLSAFASDMRPGYVPADDSHPLAGRRGVLVPTCTADFNIGRHTVSYDGGSYQAHHHGARNVRHTLASVKASFPALKDIALFGGGGGGVSAAAWMGEVAREWLDAKVTVLADSGMLMYPGGNMYRLWRDEMPWGPSTTAGLVSGISAPNISTWSDSFGIATQLAEFNGRVRIAFLSCERDTTLFNDIRRMREKGAYSGTNEDQITLMWCFLATTEQPAPAGSAYSYIGNCNLHHLTREGLGSAGINVDGGITAEAFVEKFLQEQPLTATSYWSHAHTVGSIPDCKLPTTSPVVTPTATPTPAPTALEVDGCRATVPAWCWAFCSTFAMLAAAEQLLWTRA